MTEQKNEIQVGQRWENPDGLCMTITVFEPPWVHYATDAGEFGKETLIQIQEWAKDGTIELRSKSKEN